jgi:hypothetical protein
MLLKHPVPEPLNPKVGVTAISTMRVHRYLLVLLANIVAGKFYCSEAYDGLWRGNPTPKVARYLSRIEAPVRSPCLFKYFTRCAVLIRC